MTTPIISSSVITANVDFEGSAQPNNKPPAIDEKRSLYNHPRSVVAEELKSQITVRLEDCIRVDGASSNRPMVSFHSPRGYQKCKNLCEKGPAPDKDPQRPSLLQHCLRADANNTPLQVNIRGIEYSVKFEQPIEFVDQGNLNEKPVSYMKGVLILQTSVFGVPEQKINFIEFSPKFNGLALEKNDLLACHAQMMLFRKDSQKPESERFLSQFSSAKGICRSASLLILDQFSEYCAKNDVSDDFDVSATVDSLIQKARNQSKNQGLIPHNTQVEEIKKACDELLNNFKRLHAQTAQARRGHPKEITVESPETDDEILTQSLKMDAMPGLQESSDSDNELARPVINESEKIAVSQPSKIDKAASTQQIIERVKQWSYDLSTESLQKFCSDVLAKINGLTEQIDHSDETGQEWGDLAFNWQAELAEAWCSSTDDAWLSEEDIKTKLINELEVLVRQIAKKAYELHLPEYTLETPQQQQQHVVSIKPRKLNPIRFFKKSHNPAQSQNTNPAIAAASTPQANSKFGNLAQGLWCSLESNKKVYTSIRSTEQKPPSELVQGLMSVVNQLSKLLFIFQVGREQGDRSNFDEVKGKYHFYQVKSKWIQPTFDLSKPLLEREDLVLNSSTTGPSIGNGVEPLAILNSRFHDFIDLFHGAKEATDEQINYYASVRNK